MLRVSRSVVSGGKRVDAVAAHRRSRVERPAARPDTHGGGHGRAATESRTNTPSGERTNTSDEPVVKPQGDIHATSEPLRAAKAADGEVTPQGDIHATDEPAGAKAEARIETKGDIHATSEPFKPAK